MLRDVIDLDATFGSSTEGELPEETKIDGFENQHPISDMGDKSFKGNLAEEFNKLNENKLPDEKEGDTETTEDEETEDFEDDHTNVSLAAMESALKPQVLKTLKKIADAYLKLSSLQNNRMLATIKEKKAFSESEEKKYQKLRIDIVELVNSLHFHNNRIEALIDQLYDK